MKLSDAVQRQSFKLIQTGEPGSGKTLRACSAVRFGRVLIIDTDNKFDGLIPRVREKFGADLANSNIEFEAPKSAAEYKAIMEKITTISSAFSTIVLDTQSRAFDLVLEDVKSMNPKGDGRAIFGVTLERNLAYLNRLLSLPQNVIINAHVGSEEMADGTSKLTSTTPGKFGKKMPEFVNEVHYCYLSANGKHSVRGEPSPIVVARTVRPKHLLDSMGIFKVDDLSIFDDVAYRGK